MFTISWMVLFARLYGIAVIVILTINSQFDPAMLHAWHFYLALFYKRFVASKRREFSQSVDTDHILKVNIENNYLCLFIYTIASFYMLGLDGTGYRCASQSHEMPDSKC